MNTTIAFKGKGGVTFDLQKGTVKGIEIPIAGPWALHFTSVGPQELVFGDTGPGNAWRRFRVNIDYSDEGTPLKLRIITGNDAQVTFKPDGMDQVDVKEKKEVTAIWNGSKAQLQ